MTKSYISKIKGVGQTTERELLGIHHLRMHLLNSSELRMLNYLPEIVKAGVSSIRIEGRGVESERAGVITRLCRAALDRCSARDGMIQSTCKGITGEYTTGHYRRGVL